jgi:hypothetical protein
VGGIHTVSCQKHSSGQCYEPFRVKLGGGGVPCRGAAASLTRAGSSSRHTPVEVGVGGREGGGQTRLWPGTICGTVHPNHKQQVLHHIKKPCMSPLPALKYSICCTVHSTIHTAGAAPLKQQCMSPPPPPSCTCTKVHHLRYSTLMKHTKQVLPFHPPRTCTEVQHLRYSLPVVLCQHTTPPVQQVQEGRGHHLCTQTKHNRCCAPEATLHPPPTHSTHVPALKYSICGTACQSSSVSTPPRLCSRCRKAGATTSAPDTR